MLVLSRKEGEQILIGNDIVLVLLDISGDRVRLGIDAPRNIHILRKEVHDRIIRNEEYDHKDTNKE